MARHFYLARLGGADRRLLAEEESTSQTGERTRSAAMGGVLLATAGVATVSMFFALHHAVGVSLGWAVPLALAWGVVIINLDRLLIITMGGTRGHHVQMAIAILSRLVLAALIAFVVATPLVLQIFASDIRAELPIVQEQQSKQFAQSLTNGADGKQLNSINSEITTVENEISGKGSTKVAADQAAVEMLTGEVGAARTTENTAYLKWQCEAGGLKEDLCPPGTSGLVGNGPLAHSDEEAYYNDVQSFSTVNAQLTAAEATLKSDQAVAAQSAGKDQQTLTGLENQRTSLQNTINGKIANDDKQNKQDTGLLEQIQALGEASAKNSGLAVAHWTVTALFFVIEILPVSVKCMLLISPETPYERIVAKKGEAAVEQAEITMLAETDAAQIRAQSLRDTAAQEAQHLQNTRAAELQSDYAVLQARTQAKEAVELDMIRRDRGTRIEANKRFAGATRAHILAAVDDWARTIRDKIKHAAQQQNASDQQQPYTQVQQAPGYNSPNGSSV